MKPLPALPPMPSIFSFTDYREYLQARYNYGRDYESPRLTHQAFSERCGFDSEGAMRHIMNGDRVLMPDRLIGVINGLELDEYEAQYFSLLVNWNQAKSPEQVAFYFDKLVPFLVRNHLKDFDEKTGELYLSKVV